MLCWTIKLGEEQNCGSDESNEMMNYDRICDEC